MSYGKGECRIYNERTKAMRRLLAVWAGKLLTIAGKMCGKKSSSGPGKIALKIYPDLVKGINSCVRKGVIITCGTNGKTTTNNLICTALEAKGYRVLCNRIGANMLTGVATAFLQEMNIFGKLKADYACFEVDEAYTPIVFEHVTPDVLVVTNLFRDQLDRYGEIELTAGFIKKAIEKAPDVKLVLNGDDPLSAQFGYLLERETKYFGVSEKVLTEDDNTKEGRSCPICGAKQHYNFYHYSQLGDYYCSECDFRRPHIDFEADGVLLDAPMSFNINGQKVSVNQKGFYNIYNIIAVYGVLDMLGESTENFSSLLEAYKPQIGRMQEFNFNKPVILSLSKNPAGFNQAISTVNSDKRKKDVIIAINDMVSDGQDISWLWDVDFDKIKDENLVTLSLSGMRMWDIGLRFKYADITPDCITSDMAEAVKKALDTDSEVVYVMVNYTAMYPTENVLKELNKKYGK